MASRRFVYIWQYQVNPDRRAEFLAAYRSDGEWAQLFSEDSSYLGTDLLEDARNQNRFATIDFWKSRSDRDSFRQRHAAEFEALDRRCEAFTHREHFVGDFIEVNEAE